MPVETTRDTFFKGRLVLFQPSEGYRSSIDALLLVHFVYTGRGALECVDLGAGSGTIGLSLLLSEHVGKVTAVEIQKDLCSLASDNANHNDLQNRYEILNSDVRNLSNSFLKPASFDLVVMNPPFWPLTHRLPSSEQRRTACHEVHGTLSDWIYSANILISKRKGRLSIVYPAKRLSELLVLLDRNHLFCTRMRTVHPYSSKPAELVLLEARPVSKGNLTILPPLFLKDSKGKDTAQLSEIVNGSFSKELLMRPDHRSTI